MSKLLIFLALSLTTGTNITESIESGNRPCIINAVKHKERSGTVLRVPFLRGSALIQVHHPHHKVKIPYSFQKLLIFSKIQQEYFLIVFSRGISCCGFFTLVPDLRDNILIPCISVLLMPK